MRLRIELGFFLAGVGRVIGAEAVDDALRDCLPKAFAMRGVADRRVELGEGAEALITIGRREREMRWRRFRRGNVFVMAKEDRLFLSRDMQDVHAFSRLA